MQLGFNSFLQNIFCEKYNAAQIVVLLYIQQNGLHNFDHIAEYVTANIFSWVSISIQDSMPQLK